MNDRDLHIIALREQGMTYADIGARVGLSYGRVADIIAEHRPALTGVGLASARADAVIRLRRGRRTQAEIASTLGLSVAGVSTIIAKHSPSLTGRRRGYAALVGEIDRLRRNLKILLLRRQGITYGKLGKQFGLTASAAHEIVAGLERLFTGPQAMRALQSRNALRNLHIIHLRRRRLSYAEIGAQVGLTPTAVNYVVASIAPSLTGREQARRDLDIRRSSDDTPKRRLSKIRTGMISRQAEEHLVSGHGPNPVSPPTVTAVPVEQIQPETSERHHQLATATEDDRLRHSIQRFGVLSPIVVSSAGNGHYVIIDGLRRYRIARALGFRTIDCVISPEMDGATREHIRFQLESTFKPLTAAGRERQERRLGALGA